ncbi:GerAB/ArcD/ProY family transporter [Paenibacillus planticolens]|uniref:GerAB/ArcD/ProY family transporter n=1 Tax=Paenibacillus planticolens TaxID=2654976 RepID=A0ABX1ZND1_9BACL|nr:GerAB/ArcD/ProY family transporter [Paenibacillus planticolens]NOV01168.1 GerAB/ArcD/ProY family transporter [Paenibacillus planticolens]
MSNKALLTMFIAVHLSRYFYIYPVKMIEATSSGHWEPILVGFLVELGCVWALVKGLSAFPNMDIVDICKTVWGNWMARLLLIPLICYLFLNSNITYSYSVESVSIFLLPNTPVYFILFLYAIPLYIAWKGYEAISRGGIAVFICVVPLVVFSLLSAISNFDFDNLYPLVDTRLSFFKRPMFYSAFFAHSGFLFLGLVKLKRRLPMSQVTLIIGLLFIFALSSIYVPMLIFGQESIIYFRFPNVLTSDTIDTEWVVFDWLPTFFVIAMIAIAMVEGAVIFWMMATLIEKLFLKNKRGIAVLVVGILSYSFSCYLDNIDMLSKFTLLNTSLCFYSIIVIPLAVILMSLRRRNPA